MGLPLADPEAKILGQAAAARVAVQATVVQMPHQGEVLQSCKVAHRLCFANIVLT